MAHSAKRGVKVIHMGEFHAAASPIMIRTLLGSCIAACLWDPFARVGGMNHFLLPYPVGSQSGDDSARFGVHAMELLVGKLQGLGAQRGRLIGKLFGGGHVLGMPDTEQSVPRRNIRFIEEFMAVEGIPVASSDLGGIHGRVVIFSTATGKAYVRRMSSMPRETRREERIQRRLAPPAPQYGEVTLFTDD